VTCTSSQPASAAVGLPAWAASPATGGPAAPLQPAGAAPCHLHRPGSGQNLLSGYSSALAAPHTRLSRAGPRRGLRGSRLAAASPVRPHRPPRSRGRGHCL